MLGGYTKKRGDPRGKIGSWEKNFPFSFPVCIYWGSSWKGRRIAPAKREEDWKGENLCPDIFAPIPISTRVWSHCRYQIRQTHTARSHTKISNKFEFISSSFIRRGPPPSSASAARAPPRPREGEQSSESGRRLPTAVSRKQKIKR